jgi:hypothetical protein
MQHLIFSELPGPHRLFELPEKRRALSPDVTLQLL